MENIIEIYVRQDNGDVKLAPEHQTVKELFSDFTPSPVWNHNPQEEEEEEEEEMEPKDDEPQQYYDDNDKEGEENNTKLKYKKRKTSPGSSEHQAPKKKVYLQKYRKEWENIPAYKPWLSESVWGNLYFYCKFCKNNNKCGRTEIEKHMQCYKHIRNSKIPQHRVQRKFTFRGLLCSVFTPFTSKDNEINYAIIPKYAKYLLRCGIKGVLINDIIGEGMTLTPSERMKVTEEWVRACAVTKQHLMVQIGGAPLKEVMEMVRHAEKKKVTAIVVLPDLYNKPKDHFDLMRYIKIVSDNANTVPLLYHHNPSYTNVNIDMTKFLADVLGEIDSFVGIIHSDDNLRNATSALQVTEDKYVILMGTDEVMLGAFASGFNSIMGVTLNFVPNLAQSINDAVSMGNINEAKEAQYLLKNILETIGRHGEWLPAMKAAMNILSPINVGAVRDPLVPIWLDKVNKMKLELNQLRNSNDDDNESSQEIAYCNVITKTP